MLTANFYVQKNLFLCAKDIFSFFLLAFIVRNQQKANSVQFLFIKRQKCKNHHAIKNVMSHFSKNYILKNK